MTAPYQPQPRLSSANLDALASFICSPRETPGTLRNISDARRAAAGPPAVFFVSASYGNITSVSQISPARVAAPASRALSPANHGYTCTIAPLRAENQKTVTARTDVSLRAASSTLREIMRQRGQTWPSWLARPAEDCGWISIMGFLFAGSAIASRPPSGRPSSQPRRPGRGGSSRKPFSAPPPRSPPGNSSAPAPVPTTSRAENPNPRKPDC